MKGSETKTLVRLGHPRFRSFSDAAESALNALAGASGQHQQSRAAHQELSG